MLHRTMRAAPEPVLQAIAPSREALGVGVEGLFTGTWLADLGVREGMPFVLGQALDMKASPGGNATHDRIDAQTIAGLLRGGLLPQASVSPAERRATRDLLRRRRQLMRKRAELLTPIQNTHSQDNRPELGKQIADTANRNGVAERVAEPAVQKRIDVDLARLGHDDELLRAIALSVLNAAKQPDANALDWLRTVPGLGEILSLVLLDEIHDIQRFPRGQDFVSSCRLVKCAKESAGKRYGTAGTKSGNASLQWAFSDAAVRFLRANPAGQRDLSRLENKHGQGEALTVWAHTLARAVSSLLPRPMAFDRQKFLTG